jgi:Amt family ammonium transporter
MLLTGLFASSAVNGVVLTEEQGWFINGDATLFLKHLAGMAFVVVYSLVGSYILLFITDKISPLRVSEADEAEGLDVTQHNEKFLIADFFDKK